MVSLTCALSQCAVVYKRSLQLSRLFAESQSSGFLCRGASCPCAAVAWHPPAAGKKEKREKEREKRTVMSKMRRRAFLSCLTASCFMRTCNPSNVESRSSAFPCSWIRFHWNGMTLIQPRCTLCLIIPYLATDINKTPAMFEPGSLVALHWKMAEKS